METSYLSLLNAGKPGSREWISNRLNAWWHTDWAIEDQVEDMNSIARPYDQWAFRPNNPIMGCFLQLALAIDMFFYVNYDDLERANNFIIERRKLVVHCWMQDSNQSLWDRISSWLNACLLTDWAIQDQAKNLNSITRPYYRWVFRPLDPMPIAFHTWLLRYKCLLLLIAIIWYRQVIF